MLSEKLLKNLVRRGFFVRFGYDDHMNKSKYSLVVSKHTLKKRQADEIIKDIEADGWIFDGFSSSVSSIFAIDVELVFVKPDHEAA